MYCYRSLKNSLLDILTREGVLDLCEQWRHRQVPSGCLGDVHDGRIWNEFFEYNGKAFLSQAHNIALMLNCDWFQPYDHTEYSVGVLY